MADPREKVDQECFQISSSVPLDRILKAGRRVAEASKTPLTSTVHEHQVGIDHISYVIKGPGGVVTQMDFDLRWGAPDPAGRRWISLDVGDFKVIRQFILGVIPGPRVIPALKSLRKFSTQMQRELGGSDTKKASETAR